MGLDLGVQRRLVLLHGQEVLGLPPANRPRDFLLAAHRVDGHYSPGNIQRFQQFRDGRDLVRLGVHRPLPQRDPVGGGEGADHVKAPRFRPAGGPHRLAVDRHVLQVRPPADLRHPRSEAGLERIGVQVAEERGEGVVARDAVGQFQVLLEPVQLRLAEDLDGHPVVGPRHHRADRQEDDVQELVPTTTVEPVVGEVGEVDHQAIQGRGGLRGKGHGSERHRRTPGKIVGRTGDCRRTAEPPPGRKGQFQKTRFRRDLSAISLLFDQTAGFLVTDLR